jgi:hypothetical protein
MGTPGAAGEGETPAAARALGSDQAAVPVEILLPGADLFTSFHLRRSLRRLCLADFNCATNGTSEVSVIEAAAGRHNPARAGVHDNVFLAVVVDFVRKPEHGRVSISRS